MLSGKELSQLKKLQDKAKKVHKPLTEDDLEGFDDRVTAIYDNAPAMLGASRQAWNAFTESLSSLADDNARLIAEIRRLNNDRAESDASDT